MNGKKDESFSSRLKAAERRNGLTVEEKTADQVALEGADKALSSLALRAGTEMLSALDRRCCHRVGAGSLAWNPRTCSLFIFALLGGGSAGVLNVWRLVRTMDSNSRKLKARYRSCARAQAIRGRVWESGCGGRFQHQRT
jgi:ATP synthase protein I